MTSAVFGAVALVALVRGFLLVASGRIDDGFRWFTGALAACVLGVLFL